MHDRHHNNLARICHISELLNIVCAHEIDRMLCDTITHEFIMENYTILSLIMFITINHVIAHPCRILSRTAPVAQHIYMNTNRQLKTQKIYSPTNTQINARYAAFLKNVRIYNSMRQICAARVSSFFCNTS